MTRIVRPLGLILLLQSLPLAVVPVASLVPAGDAVCNASVEPLQDPRVDPRPPVGPIPPFDGDRCSPPVLTIRLLQVDERRAPAGRRGDPAHPRRGPPCR